ncbi:MAG: hypothetical protein H6Q72_4942 [Firmicutes bacterium]|nr:hypothetical protein [Bacillota bacterium]
MADFFSLISNTIQEFLGTSNTETTNNNSLDIQFENTNKRLTSINENMYPEYKKSPQAFLAKPGAIWFVRKELEAARFYLTGGAEGYGDQSRINSNGFPMTNSRFWELKALLAATEGKVEEIERAKGYTFTGVENNNIFFKNIETDQVLSAEASSEI